MDKLMIGFVRYTAIGAVAVLASLLASPASAQQRHPLPQVVLSRGAVTTTHPLPMPASPRDAFGQILALRGNRFTMRTRSGRIVTVDATAAVARGTFSAPLFAGKFVVVNGSLDASHVFHATAVTRMTHIDNATPADR